MNAKSKITDPQKAQAAVAYLIAQGWQINLAELNSNLPGGLQSDDWLAIANGCLDFVMDRLAQEKIIPIGSFRRADRRGS